MPQSKEERFSDIDRILGEVREMLTLTDDTGDLNELIALQMLLELTKELYAIHDVKELITKVLDSALAFINGGRAFIMLLEEDGIPHFKMGRDQDGNYLPREAFSPSWTVIEQVMQQQKTLIVPDAQTDEILSKRKSIQELALRTIICSPMMIKKQLIGLLYVDSTASTIGNYSRAHVSVLASLADQAAVAIRNAQKFETYT